MTDHRSWLTAFELDAAALSDLFAAARDCMAEGDDCDPELCPHPEQRMTPLEFAQWVELEVKKAARAPIRLDQRENRQAGQYRRHGAEMVASR